MHVENSASSGLLFRAINIFMKKPAGKYSATTGLRIEPALRAELEAVDEKEDRSVAQMIRVLIREALQARKRKGKGKG